MKSILNLINKHQAIDALINHQPQFANLSLENEALLIAASFTKQKRNITIVKPNGFLARQLYESLTLLLESDQAVELYSQEDSLRVEEIASSLQFQSEKIKTMASSLDDQAKIIVTHIGAIIKKVPPVSLMKARTLHLKTNQNYDYQAFVMQCLELGFNKTIKVDQPMFFSYRGSIVDIYDASYDHPLRIEFFDDEIESIRFFDVHTQRTIKTIQEVTIYPTTDLLWNQKDKEIMLDHLNQSIDKYKHREDSHLLEILSLDRDAITNDDYHPRLYPYYAMLEDKASFLAYQKDNQVIMSPLEQVKAAYEKNIADNVEYLVERFNQEAIIDYEKLFFDYESLAFDYQALEIPQFESQASINLGIFPLDLGGGNLEEKLSYLKQYQDKTIAIFVSAAHLKTLLDALVKLKMPYLIATNSLIEGTINIYNQELAFGFELPDENLMVISELELFQIQRKAIKYDKRYQEAESLSSYEELKKGDYIVHKEHGIGKYLGIVNKEINGIKSDYLHVQYRDQAKLYIPLEQFQIVRKFVSMEGIVPRLNKLGTSEWQKTKARVSESVLEIAESLLNLYQEREQNIGFTYGPDNEDQKQFELDFEHDLTQDQAQAILEIKGDMENARPMDRLLCGDVGFGKTEVAMVAAFKAVNNNKQVAFLCPTTVLSFQHIKTFKERFKNHAINIEVINRFVTPAKQKQILRDLKAHKIDILIGTHRIFSNDVNFKDLGLLIIDEEQRFGVEHKEKIKQLKKQVDVLSLSATPIPRTLQMSLVGLRSLSQLNTPPKNRMPIQTYVVKKNKMLIKEIIERELARQGQVFYLFNQIERIYQVANQIQNDIPQAKVGVAHGQMDREEIEDVMIRFINNEYQILVCTTIIETGIDIPNANTMIVDQAQNFGLSQLYQIRGRVGRSDKIAYTYLMYPSNQQLTEIATKRLQSIKEFTQLGSGYKIAMRDLTIRGAGDMLGEKQSGFINTVGMDMYIELLKEAIATKRHQPLKQVEISQPLNLQVEAYIPKSFSDEDSSKISMYQTIQKIKSLQSLINYEKEVIDNYGRLPAVVDMLFEKKRLEILVGEKRIERFRENVNNVECVFTQKYSEGVNGVHFFEIINSISVEIKLKYVKNRISIVLKKEEGWVQLLNQVLIKTKEEKVHAH